MTTTNDELYGGAIDWNLIYRTYYPLDDIASAVMRRLPSGDHAPILFSGFAEVAELLSSHRSVQLVEYSRYMIDRARLECPAIGSVVHGDILEHLVSSEAKVVCIVCRISANWHSPACLDRLLDGLIRHPRERVLIDFFDSAAIEKRARVETGAGAQAASWSIKQHHCLDSTLGMHLTRWRGRYQINQSALNYSADIASFGKRKIAAYMKQRLADYDVGVEDSLVPSDPSFLVVISAAHSRCL
ncbi:hypothetical protein [Pseudomonas benzenivorans]|uniref:Methyltransferase domain-containing protein n=1 Tax=Pseudomonas benzenivorans TaxID=556533 RepID=A0ABY5H6X2_9PSED|nr:hypothetical protein [Pseudomonas benzenivorans]UTW08068.1 hypothetical protein KDW96_01665 [Pseudomonas benzenivorans]